MYNSPRFLFTLEDIMQALITVGLGFGDEGKGSVVDYLCRRFDAGLVVRYNGGHQAGHNVVLPDGRSHTFSQFGAGTFAGVKTYLGRHMIVEPIALRNEAEALINKGVSDPASSLIINYKSLVTTPWQKHLNRIKELSRVQRDGSCGVGVGETRKYWLDYGKDALTFGELQGSGYSTLTDKLELIRQRVLIDAESYDNPLSNNRDEIKKEIKLLYDLCPKKVASRLCLAAAGIAISDGCPRTGTAIFEGSQGILLDEFYGFHPHTTWSTTTSRHAFDELGTTDNTTVIGITRSYMTRHGAGPLPTEDVTIKLKDYNNPYNSWQQNMRFGYLDVPLLQYAVEADGNIDSIFVTHMDNCLDKVCVEATHKLSVLPTLQNGRRNAALLSKRTNKYEQGFGAMPAIKLVGSIFGSSFGPTHEHKRLTCDL